MYRSTRCNHAPPFLKKYYFVLFLVSTETVYWQHYLVDAWLVPREAAAVSAQVLWTPYSHAPVYSVFIQSHIRRVHVCLVVTWHLYLWQDDKNLLRAAAVTGGWNRYRNKSQLRKLTLEKNILPPYLRGLESGTFRSRVIPATTTGPVIIINHTPHLCDQFPPSVM